MSHICNTIDDVGLFLKTRDSKKRSQCWIFKKLYRLSNIYESTKPTMDNLSINNRTRSYSFLNTVCHEKQQEIDLLNKQICVKDNIITDLKARLGRHERLYMPVGDKESVLIARQAEVKHRLNAQLREKELELETIRCQPDHEKDQEIQRLRAALQERDRAEATRNVLCTSLAEEADQLRGQLSTTVKVCQELMTRLQKDKRGGGELEDMSSDMDSLNAQIRQLQDENQQLKQRVAYVQNLNSQWQKYDSSREDYIKGLCQRLKESTGQGLMPVTSSVNSGLLHQEISRLNNLLEDKMRECARLVRENEEIRRQDNDRIQTLEQQVLIYTEDFKSERADRERAQGQIDALKEQLKQQESRDVVPMCRVHIGHRISSKRSKDTSEPLLRTTAERRQQPAAAAATPNSAWNECPVLSELQCPQCQATFSDTETTEYLNHCLDCARL
uniref:TNFAIP3 interacting protein 2 n=1 Tax=Amphilophus citrinellus TaxID=61819 RepID=A0A3Q0S1P9_AMPCI